MFKEGFKISSRIGISFVIVLLLGMTAVAAGVHQLGELAGAPALNQALSQEMKDSVAATRTLMLTLGVTAAVAGIGFSIWLISSIVHPLAEAIHIAETVKSGDLSQEFESERTGEFGRLLRGLGDMEDKLTDVVTEIRKSSDAIMVASKKVSTGNGDLSARTRQLAGSLEETVISVGALSARVKQNAGGAQRAYELALSTSALAAHGGSDVKKLGDSMGDTIASSKKIVEIVAVIDGIALQTNILALNAAVEAARAGENGRGFAIVAGEVRNLAQRSAIAAKEIKALIEEAADRIDEGHERALNAGRKINEIVSSVQGVTEIVADISAACAGQTTEIEQINQVIAQMDKVTQQNAALVEKTATAAAAMQDEATALAQSVRAFKLDAVDPVGQISYRDKEYNVAPPRAVLGKSNSLPLMR